MYLSKPVNFVFTLQWQIKTKIQDIEYEWTLGSWNLIQINIFDKKKLLEIREIGYSLCNLYDLSAHFRYYLFFKQIFVGLTIRHSWTIDINLGFLKQKHLYLQIKMNYDQPSDSSQLHVGKLDKQTDRIKFIRSLNNWLDLR